MQLPLRPIAIRVAMLVTLIAVLAAGLSAAYVSAARADYYWGCTYTYPNSCLEPGSSGVINRMYTMDDRNALEIEGKTRAPFNGYKKPEERAEIALQVCSTIYEGGVTVPWLCAYEASDYQFPEWHWGHAMMGSEIAYKKVSMWQDVNIYE